MNKGLKFSDIDSDMSKKGNKDTKNSILNLEASNTAGSQSTDSLKENLKEGIKNIESRRTRSLKTLPSISLYLAFSGWCAGWHAIFYR
jgi:hypothetical protein